MDKLERYLDQVCRGIGGPRSMRQHVRRELREHLLDAAAEHQAAGMTEEQALDRALEDFGGPDQMRSELEATHGHRVTTVLIDKAMQWKEKTMKAKWLWTTWAHLALVLVIATGALFIVGTVIFVIPKFEVMVHDGWLAVWGPRADRPGVEAWCGSVVWFILMACRYWVRWVIPLAIGWGLFEWRVRNENKSLMRLGAMGTVALMMTVAATMFLTAIALPFFIEMPVLYSRPPEPLVRKHISTARASIDKVDDALTRNDWPTIKQETWHLSDAMWELAEMGGAAPVIAVMEGQTNIADVRAKLRSAQQTLQMATFANEIHDAQALEEAISEIRALLNRVPAPTTVPAQP